MEDRLNQIAERLRQVERELADPAVYSDQQRLKNLSREQKELTPVVETFTALQQTEQAIAEAREMLSDPELRELAQEELTRTKEQRERLAEELKRLLLPRDPNDEKSVVLEIRGGVGGEEGALFAADLLRMYTMYAERRGWQLEIVSQNVTELGGVKEVCATVEGDGAWSRLKFEAGTHRVQRVPETESGGRIQTSAATVAVMPEAEETELSIDPKDLRIDTFRSSGAGGQHVNKTESAIRITHLPTGTVVECQDERSQYKNKDRAMKILRSKLYEAEQARQNAEIAATRRSQVGTGDRSGKIRTYNFPQNRVTDHRLTGDSKNFNLAAVINGDLDALIDALTLADQTRRLQEGYEKGELALHANTKTRYDTAGPQVVKALEKRHFEAYYVSTAAEAVEKVVELIPKEHTVSWGGTATVDALGIKQRLAQEGIALIDRDTAQTPQERQEMLKKALTCGTFLMSSNAISADGQLVNIDGTGNRVAALCFGPEQVIVVAGMNKVTGDLEGAMRRAREVAAPVNAQRFAGLKTPCSVTGLCADCTGPDSICCQIVTTRICRPAGRIKVVLVGEELGF